MKVLTFVNKRPNCGVSYYAEQLDGALRVAGAAVCDFDIRQAPQEVRRADADLFLFHQEHTDGLTRFEVLTLPRILAAARARKKNTAVIVHTLYPRARDLQRLPAPLRPFAMMYQWTLLRLIAAFSKIIVLSENGHELLAKHGIPSRYVPLGTYTAHKSDSNGFRAPQEQTITVGVVGHPYSFKHFEKAAAAMAALPASLRDRWRFQVIGGEPERDPAAWQAFRDALKALPADRVTITGPLEEQAFLEALIGLDVALMPYEDKPIGSSVLSYILNAGCAMVVSGARVFDAVVEGGAAMRAASWDEEAARCIEQCIVDPSLLQRLRTRAEALSEETSIVGSAKAILAGFAGSERAS